MIQELIPKSPDLSVIIIVVTDSNHLTRCLKSLTEQVNPPSMEIIVPYESDTMDSASLRSRFPMVHFHEVTGLKRSRKYNKPSHELLDRMRAIGIKLARGGIVALLEDHERVDENWSLEVITAHKTPYAVIGGAIENEIDRPLNWAVYFCDFGRYQNPLKEGPSHFLSDVNISYKRHVLEFVKDYCGDIYHEPFVNGALRSKGEVLWLSPKIIVYQHRENLRLGSALRERVDWGRYYAGNRVKKSASSKRFFYAVFSPLLPFLLITRITCTALIKKRFNQNFIKAFPLIFPLTIFWSFGELIGYITAKPNPI
jgi:hypothetical protein